VELHKKVTPWKEIGEVHIREFSRETLTRGDAVADAVSFCLGDDAELALPSLRLNTSLSAEGMALLQKLSRDCYSQDQPTAHVPAAIRRLRDLLQRIEADYSGHFTKPKPLEGVVAHLDSHDEDLERLSVDFGFRFTSFDSPSADGASCGKTLDVADVKDLVCVDPAKFDHLQTLVLHELLKEEPRSPLSALAAALKGRIRSSRLGTLARMLRRRGPWSKSPDRRL
jgi:hypothetical protein